MSDKEEAFDLFKYLKRWSNALASEYNTDPEVLDELEELGQRGKELAEKAGIPYLFWLSDHQTKEGGQGGIINAYFPHDPTRGSLEHIVATLTLHNGFTEAWKFLAACMEMHVRRCVLHENGPDALDAKAKELAKRMQSYLSEGTDPFSLNEGNKQ